MDIYLYPPHAHKMNFSHIAIYVSPLGAYKPNHSRKIRIKIIKRMFDNLNHKVIKWDKWL